MSADVVWRIGDPELGPHQFNGLLFMDGARERPVFRVGTATERSDWAAYQPAPLQGPDGAGATQEVVFAPVPNRESWYELELHVYCEYGPSPRLRIDVNGREGIWLVEPRRDDRRRVWALSATSGWATLRIPVPGAWLGADENRVRITTIAQEFHPGSGDRPLRISNGYYGEGWFGGGVAWGSLALRRLDTAPQPELAVRATPFYVVRDGVLCELVDVVATLPSPAADVRVGGSVGAERLDFAVTGADEAGPAYGQHRLRVAVPDTDGAAIHVHLALLAGEETIATVRSDLAPARKWTLHLLPHVHLDVGFTDHQGKVLELHSRNLERVLEILERSPDYAFTVDGSLILDEYEATRHPAALQRVAEAARRGRLGVNAFYALFLTGVASLEECYRAAYCGIDAGERLDFPVDHAHLTDVASYSWATPSIVDALGLRGFFGIMNHTRGGNDDSDALHLRSPFRWQGPDGRETLAWFADTYSQLRFMSGDPITLAGSSDALSRFVSRYERDDYPLSDLPIVGTCIDNEDLGSGETELVQRWNDTYAYPRLRHSTMAEYFTAVAPLRDRLEVLRGDGGSYWEDGVGSDARAIAQYRRAQVLLPDAGALAALLTLVDARLAPNRERFARGWRCLLLGCEHTWTSVHVVSSPDSDTQRAQLHWKEAHIDEAEGIALDEMHRCLSQLGELVTTDGPTLLLANPLSWARDSLVDVEVPTGRIPDGVECELLAEEGAFQRLRVRTGAIPPFGYRAIPLRDGSAARGRELAVDAIETGRHVVRVDGSGRVVSLWQKDIARELLSAGSGFALAEVLYVSGGGTEDGRGRGDERTTLHDRELGLPVPDLHVTPASMTLLSGRATPWGVCLEFSGSAPSIPSIRTRIDLQEDSDRVDVEILLRKERVLAKESVYVAFPFDAGATPQVRYDRQQGWVDPRNDHTPGACNEWFTTQYGVAVTGEVAIDWTSADAPLFTIGDVVRGRWPVAAPVSGTILSWVMNNHWFTNYPASQQGEVRLRYSFSAGPAWDPARAARFGRQARHAPLAGVISFLDKADNAPRPLPGDARTLYGAALPTNVIASLHDAHRTGGIMLRLLEAGGRRTTVSLPHPRGGAGVAWLCDAAERPQQQITVDGTGTFAVDLMPWAAATVVMATR